jgi:hypothetical protein
LLLLAFDIDLLQLLFFFLELPQLLFSFFDLLGFGDGGSGGHRLILWHVAQEQRRCGGDGRRAAGPYGQRRWRAAGGQRQHLGLHSLQTRQKLFRLLKEIGQELCGGVEIKASHRSGCGTSEGGRVGVCRRRGRTWL